MSTPRLQGKVAIVTAATAGIGLGIATRLGKEGANVVICSRKEANVQESVDLLKADGIEVTGCVCHVANAAQRKRLIQTAVEKYGRVDILVSNAAVNPAATPILETPDDAIDKIFEINVKAAIALARDAVPHMPAGSAIVFVSSVTAFNPPLPIGVYAISKTALLGLTKGLAAELGPRDIRVNCVAPGIVPTKFASYLTESPEIAQQQIESTALKRLGKPEDMAAAVAYLVSDDASYVTGETIVVAGGTQSRL